MKIVVEGNVSMGVSEDGNPRFPEELIVKLSVPSEISSGRIVKAMEMLCRIGGMFLTIVLPGNPRE